MWHLAAANKCQQCVAGCSNEKCALDMGNSNFLVVGSKLRPVCREVSSNRRLTHISVNKVWEKVSLAVSLVAAERGWERERERERRGR